MALRAIFVSAVYVSAMVVAIFGWELVSAGLLGLGIATSALALADAIRARRHGP